MAKYLIRRAIFVLAALIGATVIMFAISRMGGPFGALVLIKGVCGCYGISEEKMDFLENDLARPMAVQYAEWWRQTAQGDWGTTGRYDRPVTEVIQETGWNSVKLVLSGWLFAVIVGVPLGVLAALNRSRIWGFLGGVIAMFGRGMPAFLVGIALILVFAIAWEIFPAAFSGGELGFKHFVLPAIAVGLGAAAGYFQITRDALKSELRGFALAKGGGAKRRALKNALIAPLALSTLLIAGLINGAIVAELVFGLPGLGRAAIIESVVNEDSALLVGAVFIFTIIYLAMNFAADALRAWADPRIRYS